MPDGLDAEEVRLKAQLAEVAKKKHEKMLSAMTPSNVARSQYVRFTTH